MLCAGLCFIPLFKPQCWANTEASRFKPWTDVGDSSSIRFTPRKPPRWALASTVPSILSSPVSATQPRHFQTKASPFQASPRLNEWAEETQIWIWPSYIYRGMLTVKRSNEQSINVAPLAPFFQLIPVMYLNVTFTMLWCFYSLYNVAE